MTSNRVPSPHPVSKRLDHLPIVAHYLQRLRVRELVDELVPTDPRSRVSAGECVEVLATIILLGKHTLYRAADFLEPYDLPVAFGFDRAVKPRHFNDERLGKALDDLFDVGGVAKVNAAAALQAIREFELSLDVVHTDTTTVSVHGEYLTSTPPVNPDADNAVPHVTRGYSKDKRPDLKQILYGISVSSDGAVPVFGRTSSGNRSDPLEIRYLLDQIRQALPSPQEILYVADSKLFSGETLALLTAYDLKFVTLLPKSVGLWQEAFSRFCKEKEPAPVLKVKEQGEEEAAHEWRGRSYDLDYEFDFDHSHYSIPLRLLVVESDALKERKRGIFERREAKERLALTRLQDKYASRTYACEEDARREKARILERAFIFHSVKVRVTKNHEQKKRSRRGRPKKNERPELVPVWSLSLRFEEDPVARASAFRAETSFVLVTNVLVDCDREAADRATLTAYDGQNHVERCFRWTKHPLEVAPIFLKSPKRIAALGLVYVLALMVYALIQRDVRARLQARGEDMPGNKRWTDNPTTEVIFRLFENINTVWSGDPDEPTMVTNLNTQQVRILQLMDVLSLRRPGVEMVEPRAPVPGERAFRPIPRTKR